MYGCEIVWLCPIGSGWLRYARCAWSDGTSRWRSTFPSAARTRGAIAASPVSERVSAYMASTSATRRARWAAKSCASAPLMPSQASTRLASLLVAFDESVGGVVVDRLEILG